MKALRFRLERGDVKSPRRVTVKPHVSEILLFVQGSRIVVRCWRQLAGNIVDTGYGRTMNASDATILDLTLLSELLFNPGAKRSHLEKVVHEEGYGHFASMISGWLEARIHEGTVTAVGDGFTLRKESAELVYLEMSWCSGFGWGQSTPSERALTSPPLTKPKLHRVRALVSAAWHALTHAEALPS